MVFKIDYVEDAVLEWSIVDDGAACRRVADYTPTIYTATPGDPARSSVRGHLRRLPGVETTAVERWRTGWRHEPEDVLRIDVSDLDAVREVATCLREWGDPGTYKPYNVDFSREFRYCLETGIVPVPEREPTVLEIGVPRDRVRTGAVTPVTVDDETEDGPAGRVLERVGARLADVDPDVLVLSASELVPLFHETAHEEGIEFRLGRRPGWQELAGRSTYESYGRVGHSPPRYSVPGRAIVDLSNTFFWNRSNLGGVLDLVERSLKPIQEVAWASIGNVLTAIQIREALARDVLVPWNSWRHERFKSMRTLHDADRGGVTFSPDVGVHAPAFELDFASLYPNIIRTRNVSPETVRCDCHGDREDVPGLGYSICDEEGYLPDVLRPLIRDREAYKAALRRADDPAYRREIEAQSDAIKWILVSCFGYQGFSNAKFGRIECHEAINAFAREILLETKEVLEANGWRVAHGIVDSLWVAPAGGNRTPLDDLCARVTDDVGIELQFERAYDWIAFVPRRESDAGALNRYFGKVRGEDAFKFRGIECRQRSTPPFVADAQVDLVEAFDRHREPEPVCDRLRRHLRRLRAGEVDPADLRITQRVSKSPDEYEQFTRNVAALERADADGVPVHPGEDVPYVVVDDDKRSQARVALDYEDPDRYDEAFYADLLCRAAESVLSPVGWDRRAIDAYLAERSDASLAAFGTGSG